MQKKCADFTDSIRQEKRSSDSLFPFFSQQEIRHTREVGMMRQDIGDREESGRFRGVWKLRLMRAVTVRVPGLSFILTPRELPYERRPPGISCSPKGMQILLHPADILT